MPSKSNVFALVYWWGWEGEGVSAWCRGWIKQWDLKFHRVSFLAGWSGGLPRGNFENQECRRSHLRSFWNAIQVSNLPELCLFADDSEENVPVYSMLWNVFEAGRSSSDRCAYGLASRQSQVRSSRSSYSFVEIWSWKNSTTILSLLPIQEGQLSVTAKECALSTAKLPRRLAQEQCGKTNRPCLKWPKMCQRAVKQ